MHANRLPTTHQLHAATPPLLDLLAALHWMQSGINWSSNALTCTECTITQGQSAMLCFTACGKLSHQAHTCTDCKTAHVHVGHGKLLWQQWPSNLPHRGGLSNLQALQGAAFAGTWKPRPASISAQSVSLFVGCSLTLCGASPCKKVCKLYVVTRKRMTPAKKYANCVLSQENA